MKQQAKQVFSFTMAMARNAVRLLLLCYLIMPPGWLVLAGLLVACHNKPRRTFWNWVLDFE